MRTPSPTSTHSQHDSPVGPLTLVADDGALAGLYMTDQRHRPPSDALGERVDDALPARREQLEAYFARRADDLRRAARAWTARRSSSGSGPRCARIPYGETRSYGELAQELGRPTAPARSAPPTAGTRSASSSRATA